MPDKLITPLTGNSKPVYTSPEDYYNKNMELLKAGLYQPKEIRSDCMPYLGWMPFTSLLSYNNDPLQLISAITKWADQSDSVASKMQYGIIPTDYFYETLADGHTYRFRIADKDHYRTKSFTKTHYTVIADELYSETVAFNSDRSKGNDYSVSDLRKVYQTKILNQFNANQQASMVVAPVSSYKQDGTAVQIADKIYPMSNFEMSGQKVYSNEKEVLPGGTESPNWHFDYMYSRGIGKDQTRRKSSFNATVNGAKDQWGAWYWLRTASASDASYARAVDTSGILNGYGVSNISNVGLSLCFNLG
jgi:hypothetical protein